MQTAMQTNADIVSAFMAFADETPATATTTDDPMLDHECVELQNFMLLQELLATVPADVRFPAGWDDMCSYEKIRVVRMYENHMKISELGLLSYDSTSLAPVILNSRKRPAPQWTTFVDEWLDEVTVETVVGGVSSQERESTAVGA